MSEAAVHGGGTIAADTAPIYSRATGLREQARSLRGVLEAIEANFHGGQSPPEPAPGGAQPEGPANVWALLSQTQEALSMAHESAARISSMLGAP